MNPIRSCARLAAVLVLGALAGATSARAATGPEDANACVSASTCAPMHTAVHAHLSHRRGHLALHHARHPHVRGALVAARATAPPLGPPRAPEPASPRDSRPRAALPHLLKLRHVPASSGGGRGAVALPGVNPLLSVTVASLAPEQNAAVNEPDHELTFGRGPPRSPILAQPLPAFFARSRVVLPPALFRPPTFPSFDGIRRADLRASGPDAPARRACDREPCPSSASPSDP